MEIATVRVKLTLRRNMDQQTQGVTKKGKFFGL